MLRLVWLGLLSSAMLLAQNASVEQAWNLAGAGHPEDAIRILNGVVSNHPDDPEARLLLGTLLSEQHRYEEAVTHLCVAVQLQPRSAEAENALGEAYSGFGDKTNASEAFEKAVALNPNLIVAQTNLARTLIDSQQWAAAAVHLDRALQTHDATDSDDKAIAHYLRAKIYQADNDPRLQAVQLEAAVSSRPNFAAAWSDLGEARKTLLDHAGALAAFHRAIQLAPNDSVAQYRLGEEYLVQHQPHLAVEPLTRANQLSPGDQSTLNALMKALRLDGQTAAAENVKQELSAILDRLQVSAQDELAAIKLNNEGASLEKSGDLRSAVVRYRAAVKLSPHSVPIRVNYAIAMLRLGQWTTGLNELHNSLLMDPANSKIKAALQDALNQAPAALVPQWNQQ